MSVFRVITRIIPLNSSESTFEPASFDQLTDGSVGEVKVLNLTEPQSGMKYRIERMSYVQNAGPGESIEAINKAYAEKLKTIPGFVQLQSNDLPQNPYDKSFQLTLPKVLFGQTSDNSTDKPQQRKSSDSFKISVVKNFNFKKGNPKPKRTADLSSTSNKCKKDGVNTCDTKTQDGAKCKALKSQALKTKPKFPYYRYILRQKWRKSNWETYSNFIWFRKPPKKSNYYKRFLSRKNPSKDSSTKNLECPSSSFAKSNKKTDMRKDIKKRVQKCYNKATKSSSFVDGHNVNKVNGDVSTKDKEKNDCSDDISSEFEGGDLIINVPESAELNSAKDLPEKTADISDSAPIVKTSVKVNNSCSNSDDSSLGVSDSSVSNQTDVLEDPTICRKFIIPGDHPAYDLLLALKKYFRNGECLICGFIPTELDFNAFEHMKQHTLSNSFTSSYKCSCCEEKFSDPVNLYKHSLSREKSYNYMCNICNLTYKRKHYLSIHTAKSH